MSNTSRFLEDPAHPNKDYRDVKSLYVPDKPQEHVQYKYVKDILNKFDFRTIKPASTPIEAHKSLEKIEGEDVRCTSLQVYDWCLMYLTASRTDIMFAVWYLKHQPNLGLWYPKDSPFHLEAFSDSDYAGDITMDKYHTSGGCHKHGRRLVFLAMQETNIVAISIYKAEYVAAASFVHSSVWMQNQLLDYGFNFMNTENPYRQ
ncbi:hypothetical protein Tco_1105096 [Tanacetum coccineum]